MSLDIGEALNNGFNRTFQRNGLMIAGLVFVTGLLNTVMAQTLLREIYSNVQTTATQPTPLALPIGPVATGVLWIPVAIFSIAVGITALRTFVSQETESILRESYTRNMAMAILNTAVGSVVFGILVAIGFIFLIVPGIFLLVSLYFWTVYVAVEEQNFVEAFRSSWNLTKGNRLMLLLLGLIVGVISWITGIVTGAPTVLGLKAVGVVTTQIGGALVSVFGSATLAQVYNQLK